MTRSHMMRSHGLFLLLYLMGLCWGMSLGLRNGSCPTGVTCAQTNPSEGFLQCVGLPYDDTGPQPLHRLRSIMEALMDLYTFMRTSMHGVPVLSLAGELDLSLTGEPLQNEDLVHMWLEVKMKPLLHSVSKQLLSCLSSKNFSCHTYQLMVKDLSEHYSDMEPGRQRWIYDFFMYPFLSRDGVKGCTVPGQKSEDWLMKNFGEFRAMARIKDFSTLYMAFSGLEVLDLLTPAQKAEMLLNSNVSMLDNGTLHVVLSLMEHPDPTPTGSPGAGHNWTIPEYNYSTAPPYGPNPTSIDHRIPTLNQVWNGFMAVMKPVGSFVHEFVTFTNEMNVAEIRRTDLAQFLINFTLSELADMYSPPTLPSTDTRIDFDPTNVEDWYRHVVMPILLQFLPKDVITQTSISMAFHELFYLEHGNKEIPLEVQDVCSLTLDQCGLTDVVQDLAQVLHCAAQTRLTLNEDNILGLLYGLTRRLTSLLKDLSNTNLQALATDIKQIFTGSTSTAVTQQHLNDPDFIQTWFQVKLLPLLPDVSPELLSCLSRKNFSCPVYQTIVRHLSEHMKEASPKYQERVYENFIYPFLLQNHTSGARCVSNNSAVWLQENFGSFSLLAPITDFYRLNPYFSGVEALSVLSPLQTAELLLLPLKPQVVDEVLYFVLSGSRRHFTEVMQAVIELAPKVTVPCALYTQMLVRLYGAIPSVSAALEPHVWASIEDLISIAPKECVPENITCPVTQVNGTSICGHMSGNYSWSFSNVSMDFLCSHSLDQYACAQLDNFTANHLATLMSCDLPGNSSRSKMLWKLLLTKLSSILDPALDLLAERPMHHVGPSALEILDVLGEIRVSMFTDHELSNSSLVHSWFSRRLRPFLPHASGSFLRCLSNRNISCSSYQHILQIFSQGFKNMTLKQRHVILKNYIVRFLSHNISGPGCVSMNSSLWLSQNLGPFSQLIPLKVLLQLNPYFDPLDTLHLLTPEQSVELLTLPRSVNKNKIINELFDFYTKGPGKDQFPVFVSLLPHFVPQANLSCSDYTTLFNRLDQATASVSLETESSIIRTKMALSPHIPHGCVIYEGQCTVTVTNVTQICAGVNSTSLQLLIDQDLMNGRLCDVTVEQLACASLSALTAKNLKELLSCRRPDNSSGSRASWKLLLSKVPHALDSALDLLTNTTLDSTQAALPLILDAIREIRLDNFPQDQINHPLVIHQWLRKLKPLLPSVSPDFLHCLTTKALNCTTFQHIVRVLSEQQPHMDLPTQMSVYTHFIKVFLTRNNTEDPSCSALSNNSLAWAMSNLGAFSWLVPFPDLRLLNPDFSPMEALPIFTVRQLAELSSTPGQLQSPAQVAMVMRHVSNRHLAAFFDDFSPAITGHERQFPPLVLSAMLEVVFDKANLSDTSTPDSEVWVWIKLVNPLLFNLSSPHVEPFFRIIYGRNCSLQHQGVENLNMIISSLNEETKDSITNHIVKGLQGSLRCYGNNSFHNFYRFLKWSFMGFPFPNLTVIMSLMPHELMPMMVNTIPPPDLKALLEQPGVLDSDSELCDLYHIYNNTPELLVIGIPDRISRPTMECVWPLALGASSSSEVNVWFRSIHNFTMLLTAKMLSPNVTFNSSCVAFRKLVSMMGDYNYTGHDFNRRYMFDTIKVYLHSASAPRCFNATDPELNSTAWFASYIGPFFSLMTLEVLQSLGSAQDIQKFTVNPENMALLNHSVLPQNLTDYYTGLVYQQDSNFNPLLLPLLCRCVAPGQAFTQLNREESLVILYNLTDICENLDPQIEAALAGNFENIDASVLEGLGQQVTGLSLGQIRGIRVQYLLETMGTLSGVTGWSWAQSHNIIQLMMSGGVMQFNASFLLRLGTLVKGIPTSAMTGMSSSEVQMLSKDSTFIQNLMSAPMVTQESFVVQLISGLSNTEEVVMNVPDDLAGMIPRFLLASMPNKTSVFQDLNKKKWKREQVELFFSVVAQETATVFLNGTEAMSSSVLQGFTCTGVKAFRKPHIIKLVKGCRRRGKNKVKLVETQLNCMYYYVQTETDATEFSLYPPDVLLYYSYSLVPASRCRSYFEELADADFSVFSETLSFKRDQLFTNAKSCLGINSTSLTEDQVTVLGNMCCILEGSYIQNSNPSILEKLKNCKELTVDQAKSVETRLESGNTKYGDVSTWDLQTLKDLGSLPQFLGSTFYQHFDRKTKRKFYNYFRKIHDLSSKEKRNLRKRIMGKTRGKTRRATGCTVGEITQVTISDEFFPIDYTDVSQFESCLAPDTVRDNLNTITEKVDDEEYLKVVLEKLKQVYPGSIPENQVQVLGLASRVATAEDISQWTITLLETLAALMDPTDGPWDPSLAKMVISKYLSTAGNSLDSSELNAIGGITLCYLDLQTLENITSQSLKEAGALNVSSCSVEKLRALFNIFIQAVRSSRSSAVSVSSYQLTEPYMGGAPESYVKSLVSSDVNMNLVTFSRLDPEVMQSLNVNDVRGLLGSNLQELKSYENNTAVNAWIREQYQSDLDTLQIGLVGGRTATTSPPGTTNPTSGAVNTTTGAGNTTTGAVNTTTGAGNTTTGAGNTTTASTGPTTASTGATTTGGSTGSTSGSTTSGTTNTTSSSASPTAKPSSASSGLSLLLLLLFSTYQHIFT